MCYVYSCNSLDLIFCFLISYKDALEIMFWKEIVTSVNVYLSNIWQGAEPQNSEDSLKLLAWNFLTWSDLEYNGLNKSSKSKLLLDKKVLRKCDNLYCNWTLPNE